MDSSFNRCYGTYLEWPEIIISTSLKHAAPQNVHISVKR